MLPDKLNFARGAVSNGTTVPVALPRPSTKVRMRSTLPVDFSINQDATGTLADCGSHPGQNAEKLLEQNTPIVSVLVRRATGETGTGNVFFDLED